MRDNDTRDQNTPPTIESTTPSGPSPTTSAYLDSNSPATLPGSSNQSSDLNLEQIELVFHYTTQTFATFTEVPAQQHLWRIIAVQDALKCPFLMYGILAISALHLSHCRPEQASHYSRRATELQAVALRGFNLALPAINDHNFGPAMLFAGMLAAHVFADPSRSSHRTLNDYLEHMSSFVKLSQGGKMIVRSFWQQILNSDYAPLVDVGLIAEGNTDLSELPDAMKCLPALVASDTALTTTYEPTIEQLQRVYVSHIRHPRVRSRFSATFSWLMLVPESFHDALEKRRPEALIILAYYATLLHKQRENWLIGDAGASLIDAIHLHLGKHWNEWLAWPLAAVAEGTSNFHDASPGVTS